MGAAILTALLTAFTSTVWADNGHFDLELSVQAPATTQDPFHVHITETLVGARPGLTATITYKVVVVDPDNQQSVLLGPVTDSNSFGGGHGESTIGYWPRQNGEFTFRIIRIDGNSETLLAERRIATDKAAIIAPPVPSGSTRDGQFAVTGLRTIPEQLVVGQSVTIEVAVTNSSALPVSQTVPVVLSDDFGDQTLAIGSFTLDAGLSGTGEVSWVPDRTTVGALKAGDQILPIVVTDGVPTSGPNRSDQSESFDSPPEGAGGD